MRWYVFLFLIPPVRADEFFEARVRPVLVEHCQGCHGAAKAKGGLRLDSRETMLAGGDNGPAIVAGEPGKSRLIEAVKYGNADLQMPPKGKLSDKQIADLETWINDGAKWPAGAVATGVKEEFNLAKRKSEHWCWQPVKKPAVPKVSDQSWVRDPVDAFIRAKLDEMQLTPAEPALKRVWLRRVTFALTGLPPTVQEIEDFERDGDYVKVVDRLLASPAYGERWGRHWLDLVRYAETRGHEFDYRIPNIWAYRDYVVQAFNDDLSYRDFAREQISGMRGNSHRYANSRRTTICKVGTTFWRLGEEVHSPVDIAQDQADRFDNRIDVFGKTFLGLTISCARCHDHKFDAISTKDYYALFAWLRAGSDSPIRIDGMTSNILIRAHRAAVTSRAMPAIKPDATYQAKYDTWKQSVAIVCDFSDRVWKGDFNFSKHDDSMFPCDAGECSPRWIDGKSGLRREPRGAMVYDRYWQRLTTESEKEPGRLENVPRAGFTLRSPLFTLIKDNVYLLVRGGGTSYAAVGGHTLLNGPLHGKLVSSFKDGDYRWVKHPLKDYRGQTFRMEVTADPATEFAIALIVQADDMPSLPPSMDVPLLNADEEKRILATIDQHDTPVFDSLLINGVVDGGALPGPVYIRGNPRTLGECVEPRMPEVFEYAQQFKPQSHHMLAELGKQVADGRNPLFARVAVNRVWHHLFGRGIVASTDNFGVLGERPTHPELLDYLATEFAANGYKFKPLIKRLVLSNTYRMQSKAESDSRDAANHYLHHFRVKRLEGEAIRDAMLSISGRLDTKLGGPSVPIHLTSFMDGRGRPGKSGPLDGDGRRSIYLEVRRNFPHPFLQAFDTPTPFTTIGNRTVSNVPAQALILMNDPFVHAMAGKWGEKKPGIEQMFLQAFARTPTKSEAEQCMKLLGDNPDAAAWGKLAHALFQVKEFRYIP